MYLANQDIFKMLFVNVDLQWNPWSRMLGFFCRGGGLPALSHPLLSPPECCNGEQQCTPVNMTVLSWLPASSVWQWGSNISWLRHKELKFFKVKDEKREHWQVLFCQISQQPITFVEPVEKRTFHLMVLFSSSRLSFAGTPRACLVSWICPLWKTITAKTFTSRLSVSQ